MHIRGPRETHKQALTKQLGLSGALMPSLASPRLQLAVRLAALHPTSALSEGGRLGCTSVPFRPQWNRSPTLKYCYLVCVLQTDQQLPTEIGI
ncbi:hypothetical protein BaRGS_00001424 [Batillaria attramentaria]|uniref:Uncharacterized protein n=1 Tax=Batillaria attramentaria TaxID=370345 RepID=A0ABD0M7V0_9CAEN